LSATSAAGPWLRVRPELVLAVPVEVRLEGLDAALRDRLAGIENDEVGSIAMVRPKPLQVGRGVHGVVEGEEPVREVVRVSLGEHGRLAKL